MHEKKKNFKPPKPTMNVPATIKSLFDVVPLVTYKDERLPHKGPNYPFLEEFTVAVHNVFNCKGMIIPTDPISLGIVLVLAHKNKLALPTEQGYGRGGIITTSFHASPTNTLPLLIDQTTRTLDEINNTVANNLDEPAKLINEIIDTKFYDIWVLCILCEDIATTIFGVDTLSKLDLLAEVPNWNNFAVRHPNTNIPKLYSQQLVEFEEYLDLLESYDHPIINLKLAGYIIVINQLLSSTRLGKIVCTKHALLSRSYSLLNLHTTI